MLSLTGATLTPSDMVMLLRHWATMTTLTDGKEMVKCCLDSTDVYICKGALLSVELLRRHLKWYSALRPDGLTTLTLTLVQP